MKVFNYLSTVLFFTIFFSFILLVAGFTYAKSQLPPEIEKMEKIELLDSDGNIYVSITNSQIQNRVDLEEISPLIKNAVIAIEDKHFYTHNGFDFKRIMVAAFENIITGTRDQGASTITQQYARNIFLSHEKSWNRKILEAYFTIQLESTYSKDELLEGYLNSIYFGHGVYGIEDASMFYFGKSSRDVNLSEAAVLASIPKGPSLFSPIENKENNDSRKRLVLNAMLKLDYITQLDYDESIADDVVILGVENLSTLDSAPYFTNIVMGELDRMNFLNKRFTNLKVYTTLDSELNNYATQIIKEENITSDINLAVYAIEPNTGYVKAIIGGKDYYTSQYNRAVHASRQPGSTIKPFLYYSALEFGFTGITTFNSSKTTFYVNSGTERYSPTNYADVYPNKDITMAYAIAVSDNIYAIKTHLFLGEDVMKDSLIRFGFKGQIDAVPSLALGTSEVTLEEITTAYNYLASSGKKATPVYITRIEDLEGNILYNHYSYTEQILNKDTTYVLNELLTGMFDTRMSTNVSVTGLSIAHQLQNKYSGKSGSTDFDNWMIGYNPILSVGVWSGYDTSVEILDGDERKLSKIIWSKVIERYMEDKEDLWFKKPDNVVSVILNPINGDKQLGNSYIKPIYFIEGTEPYPFND